MKKQKCVKVSVGNMALELFEFLSAKKFVNEARLARSLCRIIWKNKQYQIRFSK